MLEYIEREEAKRTLRKFMSDCKNLNVNPAQISGLSYALSLMDGVPIADVENVVRCKDCKYLYCCSAVDRQFYCRHIHGMQGCINPYDENLFCSYGEKGEGVFDG